MVDLCPFWQDVGFFDMEENSVGALTTKLAKVLSISTADLHIPPYLRATGRVLCGRCSRYYSRLDDPGNDHKPI